MRTIPPGVSCPVRAGPRRRFTRFRPLRNDILTSTRLTILDPDPAAPSSLGRPPAENALESSRGHRWRTGRPGGRGVLAERGFRVTVLESRQRLGGRAGSFADPATGQLVDACQHVSMGCCTNLAHFFAPSASATSSPRSRSCTSSPPTAGRASSRPTRGRRRSTSAARCSARTTSRRSRSSASPGGCSRCCARSRTPTRRCSTGCSPPARRAARSTASGAWCWSSALNETRRDRSG